MVVVDYVKRKNRQRIIDAYNTDFLLDTKLEIKKIENGIVIPYEYCNPVVTEYDGDVKYIDTTVVFIDCFLYAWGHCITNNLSRLWFDINSFPPDVRFVYTDLVRGTSLPNYFYNVLSHLGVEKERLVCVSEPTRFQCVFLPDECLVASLEKPFHFYTKEYEQIISKLITSCKEIDKEFPEKIFLSREHFDSKKYFGEIEIANAFREMGYTILYPEELSFDEQVAYYQNCSIFASTEGSVSHNAIFCKKGTEVVVVRKVNDISGFQQIVNNVIRARSVFIDANKTPKKLLGKFTCLGPFFLYRSRNLSRFGKIKRKHFPIIKYSYFFSSFIFKIMRNKIIHFLVKVKHLLSKERQK